MSYGNNQGYGYGPPPGAPPTSGYAPPGGGYAPPPGGPPSGGYGPPSGGPPGSGYGPPHGGPPGGGHAPPPGGPPGGGYGDQMGPPGGGYGNSAPPPSHQTRPGSVHRPRPPSQNIDPQLRTWFSAVDRDRSNSISAIELQQALVNGDWTPFDLDTVKMLMNIFDTDRSGTVGFEEFAGLWKYIKDWQGVFRHFDADRSGTIAGHELRNALDQFGFRLPPHLLQLLERKYVMSPAKGTGSLPSRNNPEGGITFDRFVRCCVVVKALTESFQRADTDKDGWIQLSYEQFLQMALEAP
ncbi:uncharacterized protein MELLADRAFT_117078 [Melampsora larici-populina 98AG31]|uniref:EF-hand domain-containing protein n=1 Tax=Melampsora larici-populina (strain 98AG31 / pathotype 3-4-7) TaxID=747676 RepID=F4RT42_MELLP|nr:uncharacterized protein MELLADRAFT_117078 [Melampsora larici-populina 98AG31]EGG04495.1 hypothetical protein MELLADRAFT_117078 [Melampsora larici-populina 98AG31]